MVPTLRRFLLLSSLLLASGAAAHAQHTRSPAGDGPSRVVNSSRAVNSSGAVGYIFASPNRSMNLSLKEAVRKLDSAEEAAIIVAAREVACRLGAKAKVSKSVGNWADGSENSVLIRAEGDAASLRYADAWLGRRFGQKEVLHFIVQPSGASSMYIFRTKRHNLARLSKTLDGSGVAYRTMVRGRHGTTVYVVDISGGLRPQVETASRRLGASLTVFEGTGEFVGDGEASKAQAVFAGIVGEFESTHPQVTRPCANKKGR